MDDAEGSCRDCAALTAFLLDLLAAHRNRRPLTFTDIAETERILDLHWREGFTPREEQPVPEPERTTGEQGSSGRRAVRSGQTANPEREERPLMLEVPGVATGNPDPTGPSKEE